MPEQNVTVSRAVARAMIDICGEHAERPDDVGKAFGALMTALDYAQGNDDADERAVVIHVDQ